MARDQGDPDRRGPAGRGEGLRRSVSKHKVIKKGRVYPLQYLLLDNQIHKTNTMSKLRVNHVLCSVIDELNTKHDAAHVASQCVSLKGEGVPGLQPLVHCPPPGGLHCATAVTGVVGGVSCLPKSRSIQMQVYISLPTGVITALITECYQVDPGMGGGEHS